MAHPFVTKAKIIGPHLLWVVFIILTYVVVGGVLLDPGQKLDAPENHLFRQIFGWYLVIIGALFLGMRIVAGYRDYKKTIFSEKFGVGLG